MKYTRIDSSSGIISCENSNDGENISIDFKLKRGRCPGTPENAYFLELFINPKLIGHMRVSTRIKIFRNRLDEENAIMFSELFGSNEYYYSEDNFEHYLAEDDSEAFAHQYSRFPSFAFKDTDGVDSIIKETEMEIGIEVVSRA